MVNMERFWATVGFCGGVVMMCAYFLGYVGIKKDCGEICQCIGQIEAEHYCTGVNLSLNQVTAIQEILRKEGN